MSTTTLSSQTISEEIISEWIEADEEPTSNITASPDELAEKYAQVQLRVVRSTMDFTLHHLKTSLNDSTYINLAPGYQRRARWDRKKKSQLIESFLLNIPIPPLFLYENDYNQYEVMDGRQRLETISEFLDNGFKLGGLEFWPELTGKSFKDLPLSIQRGLLRRTIGAVVLLAETARGDGDFDIRMVLFRRLNTGGIKLNPQELLNAAYPGKFNDLIKRLARHKLFTDLWDIPAKSQSEEEDPPIELLQNTLYQSMMDCELVLRFFAIRATILGHVKGSLRNILDNTMKANKGLTPTDEAQLESLYLNSLSKLTAALGPRFLLLPSTLRPSRALYDALTVAVSFNLDKPFSQSPEALQTRLAQTLADKDSYEILVGRGNTVDAIKERVSLATSILFN